MKTNNGEFYDIELGETKDDMRRLKVEGNELGQKYHPVDSDYILATNSAISEHINVIEIKNDPIKWEGRVVTITKKISSNSILLHILTCMVSVSMTLSVVYGYLLYSGFK